ncbi:MAG: bifunctional folylpolyglutamate synthase/dihydrofolate synthase [Methanomassiliicoccales archaeon]|nr:bifunctional folylpolyglutamate synthase/dihydrofolate synthase [Methanomassiliicoccales archaeon]
MNATLNEDLLWLYSLENAGLKLGLSNVRALLSRLGDPQDKFGTVHVAGSNGKGSVSALTASILRSGRYRTGLYTSPHLVRFTERITIDGVEMPEARLGKMISEVRELMDDGRFPRPLTFFEITTALSFLHFADQGVEEAVVEVGMGGRLDATNVLHPRCCVITPISLEHTAFLGDTVSKIAYEKASIIKEGVPVISSPQSPEALRMISHMARCHSSSLRAMGVDFQAECIGREMEGTTVRLPSLGTDVRLGLLGRYQCENAAVAAECALILGQHIELSKESILEGLAKVRWPGRLDVVLKGPLTILDVTHTPHGASVVAAELDILPGSPRILVVGMLRDKDVRGTMRILGPHFDQVICTSARTPRALSSEELLAACQGANPRCRTVEGVSNAVREARQLAGKKGMVMVSGSLYTVGEAMSYLEGRHGP